MLQDKIKTLIKIIEGTDVDEIEVSSFWGAQKIRIRKNNLADIQTIVSPESKSKIHTITKDEIETSLDPILSQNITNDSDANKVEEKIPMGQEVIAPLVGTYYQSSKPGSPPFIKEGDTITVGQTVCIIEAMKIFNEIESEISGKVIKLLVDDASPVEYGQPLMIVEVSNVQ